MANNRRGMPGRTLEFQYPSTVSNSRGEPPDKRRRVEPNQAKPAATEVSEDLWDDDLDFMTQDQLANIDHEISMSQVPQPSDTRVASSAGSSRMVGRGTSRSQSEGNVLSSSAKTNTGQPSSLHQKNVSKLSTKYQKSNSSTNPQIPFQNFSEGASKNQIGSFGQQPKASGFKVTPQQSSNRSYPPQKPQSASSAMMKSQLTPLTGSTGSAQYSPGLPSGQARTDIQDLAQQHILKLQKDLSNVKEEFEKTKKLKCQKDGEVNMLRNDLKVTKQELVHSKQEQLKIRDQYKAEQTEKEKTLAQEIERLKTQIQFAERDRDELQTRCKVLEKRGSASSAVNDALNSPLVSQAQSPQRKQLQGNQSPATGTPKGPFPNRVTFMAEESKGTAVSPRRKSVTAETAGHSAEIVRPHKPKWQKKFSVGILNKNGRISGPSLVSLLLPQSKSDNISDQGLVGLLQVPQTKSNVLPSTTPREEDTSVVTKTNRWIQELHQQALTPECDQPSLVVPHAYYSLAVQAVRRLLCSNPPDSADDAPLLQGHTEEAVFLLPAIESYLTLYVEQLRAAREPTSSLSSTSMTSLSSSLESYDSVSSYQRSLAREIANYTHQVEQWALNALNILHVLSDFSPQVRLAVFGETERGTPKSMTAGDGNEKTSEEGSSDESIANSTSSVASNKSALRIARKCRILEHIFSMVNPVLPNSKVCCTDVIEVSLQILATLASKATTAQLFRFAPLLRQDVLQTCLIEELSGASDQRLRCHLLILDLVKSLTCSADILPLMCSSSEECLLYTMYTTVIAPPQGSCPEYRTRFGLKLVQLLSSALSNHTSGTSTILESDCHCSCEVVKMLTQLLYHGLHTYRATPTAEGLILLQEGALLLASLAQSCRNFTQQHRERDIENVYIEVIIGLHVIFKDSPDSIDHDEIIQTLWDFDVEYSPNTDDSDDAMDVT